MKNLTQHLSRLMAVAGIFFLTVVLQSSSCSKTDDVIVPPVGDYSGAWKVSMYMHTTDETSNFAGYNFTFNNAGTLTASNGSVITNGTWSQTSSKLIINFGVTPVLSELNHNWLIVEKTATSINLKDDNTTQNEQLQFTKL